MTAYGDYRKELDQILDGITTQTQDAELVEQVRQLAALRGMTAEQIDETYSDMAKAFKNLGIVWRKTKPEFIRDCLQRETKSN